MSFVLWCLFVGWANRAMLLSGLAETLLSLGLFASAISPAGSMWAAISAKRRAKQNRTDEPVVSHWTAGFSESLKNLHWWQCTANMFVKTEAWLWYLAYTLFKSMCLVLMFVVIYRGCILQCQVMSWANTAYA